MEQQKVKRFQSEAGNLIFGGYLFCSTRPNSGDLVLRSPEFFHAFRMHDSTHSCPLPDTGSQRTV